MNNVCKRNCLWNYCDSCVCECGEHHDDGTAFTKNCSQFLIWNFDERLCSLPDEIMVMLNQLPYAELKKAKYAVSQIWREVHGMSIVQKNQEIERLTKERDYWEREAKKWCAMLGEQKLEAAEECMKYIKDAIGKLQGPNSIKMKMLTDEELKEIEKAMKNVVCSCELSVEKKPKG